MTPDEIKAWHKIIENSERWERSQKQYKPDQEYSDLADIPVGTHVFLAVDLGDWDDPYTKEDVMQAVDKMMSQSTEAVVIEVEGSHGKAKIACPLYKFGTWGSVNACEIYLVQQRVFRTQKEAWLDRWDLEYHGTYHALWKSVHEEVLKRLESQAPPANP